jgi:HSP20 family protein
VQPAVNLYEDDACFYVVVDLAGVDPETIVLEIRDNALSLSGERPSPKVENPVAAVCTHVMEIDHGRFGREVLIPAEVDADGVKAAYRKGLLWITLPKPT